MIMRVLDTAGGKTDT